MTDVDDRLEGRISAALTHRAEATVVRRASAGAVHVVTWRDDATPVGRPRHTGRYAAAAAAAILVAGGLTVVNHVRQPSSPARGATVPVAPPYLQIDDPMAIDFDAWIADATPPEPQTYTVLDTTNLPEGATLTSEYGYALLDVPGEVGTYRYVAEIGLGDERAMSLRLRRSTFRPSCAEAAGAHIPVTIGGVPGYASEQSVCWEADGLQAELWAAEPRQLEPEDLTAVAESLAFTTTDALPYPEPTGDGGYVGAATDVVFGGTLNGLAWTARVDPGPLRTMFVNTAGRGGGSGFENDRLSQPEDLPVTQVDGSISGVPGYGALAFGVAPAGVATVVVTDDAGNQARLPAHARELESFFAVPIPQPVRITTLTFLDASGATIAIADVPAIPIGMGGGFGTIRARDE